MANLDFIKLYKKVYTSHVYVMGYTFALCGYIIDLGIDVAGRLELNKQGERENEVSFN